MITSSTITSSISSKVFAPGRYFYRIYTRTGDRGQTSLNPRMRLSKGDPIFEAIGTADELSCHLGLAIEYVSTDERLKDIVPQLRLIQKRIQDFNSCLSENKSKCDFSASELETWIDKMEDKVPPLRNFILPVRHSYIGVVWRIS